jgi:hypothetical protein
MKIWINMPPLSSGAKNNSSDKKHEVFEKEFNLEAH